MQDTEHEFVHKECRPSHSMGTVWLCNLKMNFNCPYALKLAFTYYCNNKNLHKDGSGNKQHYGNSQTFKIDK